MGPKLIKGKQNQQQISGSNLRGKKNIPGSVQNQKNKNSGTKNAQKRTQNWKYTRKSKAKFCLRKVQERQKPGREPNEETNESKGEQMKPQLS